MGATTIIVVQTPSDWPLDLPRVQVVSARDYLLGPEWSRPTRLRVFNLCRSFRYQRTGYYVSLLAAARGHLCLPSVQAIQDRKSREMIRLVSDELDDVLQRSLAPIQSDAFILSVYFGKNVAERHGRLAGALYRTFELPMLRANFTRRGGQWELVGVTPMSLSDVPDDHREFLLETAAEHFKRSHRTSRPRVVARYDLAMLFDPSDEMGPSDERAIRRFVRAGERTGFEVELVTGEDYGRLAEFDALFLRETTAVNHRTFRFAQRADAEGLVVIDDPASILRCTNKVFLAEALAAQGIPAPTTHVLHRDTIGQQLPTLPLPCVLKQPDSAFSQGVVKAEDRETLEREVERLLDRSSLVIAQEFVPTEFDWRIGVIDRRPLYACRYFMARRHWQIIEHRGDGRTTSGRSEALPIEQVPGPVVEAALRAANAIGDGLYGVDVKSVDGRVYVIEVNDNPSIDAGLEDGVLGDALYDRIMQVFLDRVERRARGGWSR
jgi:glutathione synthase/RimK-type ligase-like ATP-grasp enzyme